MTARHRVAKAPNARQAILITARRKRQLAKMPPMPALLAPDGGARLHKAANRVFNRLQAGAEPTARTQCVERLSEGGGGLHCWRYLDNGFDEQRRRWKTTGVTGVA